MHPEKVQSPSQSVSDRQLVAHDVALIVHCGLPAPQIMHLPAMQVPAH
jgi:hypothetical protein